MLCCNMTITAKMMLCCTSTYDTCSMILQGMTSNDRTTDDGPDKTRATGYIAPTKEYSRVGILSRCRSKLFLLLRTYALLGFSSNSWNLEELPGLATGLSLAPRKKNSRSWFIWLRRDSGPKCLSVTLGLASCVSCTLPRPCTETCTWALCKHDF